MAKSRLFSIKAGYLEGLHQRIAELETLLHEWLLLHNVETTPGELLLFEATVAALRGSSEKEEE